MANEITRGRGHRPSPEEKAEILAVVEKETADGKSVLAISKDHNYNYQTLLRWLRPPEKKPAGRPKSTPSSGRRTMGSRRRGRPTAASSPAPAPRQPRVSGSATVKIDLKQLVSDNRAAVVAALTNGKQAGIRKAILNLLES